MESTNISIAQPFSIIIQGRSGSGKTATLVKLLENHENLFAVPLKNVILMYGGSVTQPSYTRLSQLFDVEFVEGINEELIEAIPDNYPQDGSTVLVIDDLMEFAARPLMRTLFAKFRSQFKINLIFLTQILIGDSSLRHIGAARYNATALVLMFDPRSQSKIKTIARQHSLASNADAFWTVYVKACALYNYVFLDLTCFSEPKLRIRTGLGIEETEVCFYNSSE